MSEQKPPPRHTSPLPLEVLNISLVLLGRGPGGERPKIPSLACLRILLPGIKPVTRFDFSWIMIPGFYSGEQETHGAAESPVKPPLAGSAPGSPLLSGTPAIAPAAGTSSAARKIRRALRRIPPQSADNPNPLPPPRKRQVRRRQTPAVQACIRRPQKMPTATCARPGSVTWRSGGSP